MKDKDVSPDTKAVISDVYVSVRNGHDQMRDIKKAFHE